MLTDLPVLVVYLPCVHTGSWLIDSLGSCRISVIRSMVRVSYYFVPNIWDLSSFVLRFFFRTRSSHDNIATGQI